MTYSSAAAFRTALEQKIKTTAATSGKSAQRLRKVVTFDRYLARLQHVAPGRFILKGGLALDYRLGQRSRATKDLDMVRIGAEAVANRDLQRAADSEIGDYFVFDVIRTSAVPGDHEPGAHVERLRLRASVAGRLFEEVSLDLDYTGPVLDPTDVLTGPPVARFRRHHTSNHPGNRDRATPSGETSRADTNLRGWPSQFAGKGPSRCTANYDSIRSRREATSQSDQRDFQFARTTTHTDRVAATITRLAEFVREARARGRGTRRH